MQAKELARLLKAGTAPCIVDVRSGGEYASGHIPGAVHLPLWAVLLRSRGLPADKNALLVVLCEMGPRAQLAQSLLGLKGRRNVKLLAGHMAGWRRAGLPLVK
jgi:hydroxyacylglutathione hydrolase